MQNYLAQQGGDAWNGSLFVFDDRLAVPAARDGARCLSKMTGHQPFESTSKGQQLQVQLLLRDSCKSDIRWVKTAWHCRCVSHTQSEACCGSGATGAGTPAVVTGAGIPAGLQPSAACCDIAAGCQRPVCE